MAKFFCEECESRNNHRYAVVVEDLAHNGYNLIRAKQKLLRRRKRSLRTFLEPSERLKVSYRTFPWNLAILVKIYLGIIVLQHSIDLRRMVLLKEWYAESRKELLLFCASQAWMKNGLLILWNVFAKCDPFKRPVIPFGFIVKYHPISAKDHSSLHQFGKNVIFGIFFGYALSLKNMWKEVLW